MFLLYVDESGDSGIVNSPTRYYVLSGLVIHELRWHSYLELILNFRRRMRSTFSLPFRAEIHSGQWLTKPGALAFIPRNNRAAILRAFAREISQMRDLSIINVVIDKQNKPADYDITANAWVALLQRFSNTISHRNFSGPANPDERGLIVPDMGEIKKITQIQRRMKRYNPVPNQQTHGSGYRNLTITNLVEDPFFKDSRDSHFIQAADLCAFLLYQNLAPSKYVRKVGLKNTFQTLRPILCKVASSSDPDGIVRL